MLFDAMSEVLKNGSGDPASSTDPNEITIVTQDDAMYLRIAKGGQAMMNFYGFVADDKPGIVEEFFEKYPKTAQAKMQIAPVAFARLIPVKQKIMRDDNPMPKRRLSPEEFRAL